jgi:hypothetical protein
MLTNNTIMIRHFKKFLLAFSFGAPAATSAPQWFQLGSDIDGLVAFYGLGSALSLSADGTRIAVGASIANGSQGASRIFELQSGSWVQLGNDIDGEAPSDKSGFSVALSVDGNRVCIGAPQNDDSGANAGHTRVFEYQSGSWVQLGADIDGEAAGDQSGYAVSMSADGSRVAVGAPYNGGGGHTRVFELQSGSWIQIGSDIDGNQANSGSAMAVSMSASGTRVAVGAPYYKPVSGTVGNVRVFEYQGNAWVQLGADIIGEAFLDYFGWSVSLSADGNRVAAGATQNDGSGNNAGHVRVHDFYSGSWVQVGDDIDGEAADDKSGYAVALSADGSCVAIGAGENDGAAANAGHVRIFQLEKRQLDSTGC